MTAELPGGGFLAASESSPPLAPVEEPARQAGQAARDFVRQRVLPSNAALERGDHALLRRLLAEAGERGLLGAEIPASLGGAHADARTANAVVSGLGLHGSFAVTCAAHLTIGAVPLLRHGTDAQKQALLPEIAAGRRVGAYALTEPSSGSDALNLTTRARRDGDGFRITGQKQFITNAGIADQLVVFALVEQAGPTAFLVDARAPGLQLGAEEHKLGLAGSSTRTVHLDDVAVGADATLGPVGQGHRVALDALTVGRHKLGVLSAGHLELLLEAAAGYAAERRQFGRPIGERALVAGWLGEMVWRAFALRAATARVEKVCAPDASDLSPALVEAGLCKLAGSEAIGFCADAALQIHGGLGYLRGTWVEQSYRDARVNRIYEGTDEINRRAVAQGLLRALKRGRLVFTDVAEAERALAAAAPIDESAASLARQVRRLAVVALHHAHGFDGDGEPLEGPLADLALAAFLAGSAAGAATSSSLEAAHLCAAAQLERAHAAYGEVAAFLAAHGRRALPTRGLSLPDVQPRLDRLGLRLALGRRALEHGRDPFVVYDPIRPPPPGDPR
jgi:alkylation response protein AidB-like acyl-CoA dehydrogenase